MMGYFLCSEVTSLSYFSIVIIHIKRYAPPNFVDVCVHVTMNYFIKVIHCSTKYNMQLRAFKAEEPPIAQNYPPIHVLCNPN